MTLPKIDTPLTSDQLRRRVLEQEHGPMVVHEFEVYSPLRCSDEKCPCQKGNGHGEKPA